MAQKPIYPYFSNVGFGVPEQGRDCMAERMESDFSREPKARFELLKGPTQSGPSVLLLRPIKARYEVIAFSVVLKGHYASLNEFGM